MAGRGPEPGRGADTALRRGIRVLLAAVLTGPAVGGGGTANADDPGPLRLVRSSDRRLYGRVESGFRETFRGAVEVHSLDGLQVLPDALEADLDDRPPRVVVALGTKSAALLRRELGSGTTLIETLILDPERLGEPEARLRWIDHHVPATELLGTLAEILPPGAPIGVLYDPTHTGSLVERARTGARRARIDLRTAAVEARGEIEDAVDGLREDVKGLWIPPDSTLVNRESFPLLLRLSREHRLPLVVHSPELVRAGATLAVYVDPVDLGRALGEVATGIEAGEDPGPPRLPARLALNAEAAAALGLVVPERIRDRVRESTP